MSYAILWAENGDGVRAGKLVVHFDRIVLEGGDAGEAVRRELSYGSIKSVEIERGVAERLDGRPVAVLETDDNTIRIASLIGGGELNELVALVSAAIRSAHFSAA
jgi:hypothetical protein